MQSKFARDMADLSSEPAKCITSNCRPNVVRLRDPKIYRISSVADGNVKEINATVCRVIGLEDVPKRVLQQIRQIACDMKNPELLKVCRVARIVSSLHWDMMSTTTVLFEEI